MSEHKDSVPPQNEQAEEWRDIPGHPADQVSDMGRFRTRRPRCGKGRLLPDWRPLNTEPHSGGYRVVKLREAGGGRRKYFAHRLVLEAFVGPCPAGMEARHVQNNNRADNRLANLAWGTDQENQHDRRRHGTHHCGEQLPWAKMTAEGVTEVMRLWREGVPQTEIAERFGMRRENIWKIIHGRHWRHVTGATP